MPPVERDPAFWGDNVVVYYRRGGFFGTIDQVVVSTDGLLQTSGSLMPHAKRQLTADELTSLRAAFAGWDRLRTLERSGAMDAFVHTVIFNGRSVTVDDGNMPMEMRGILARIDGLRAGAADARK